MHERVKWTPDGPQILYLKIVDEPTDKPFNPDGFIELITERLIADARVGKFDQLDIGPTITQ